MIAIFGYGSLVNIDSLKKTVSNYKNLQKAKILGYKRTLNLQAKRHFCESVPMAVMDIENDSMAY